MKFLYKIYSNFDGFTPSRIPVRMINDRYLLLGWARYLDAVDVGSDCWIYFHGRHNFVPGVYVKGFVSQIDRDVGTVKLRVREFSIDEPLTDNETTARVASVVATKYRQVFLWPDDWDTVPTCSREACRSRRCDDCPTWRGLPLVDLSDYEPPPGVTAKAVVPAYWIIPNRCYLFAAHKQPAPSTKRITHVFGEFKIGERSYAYPLARGIFEALRKRRRLEFDAVIPIPLSPDKEEAGEVHRTRLIAQELGRLLGVCVREYLVLAQPVGKRRMLAAGFSISDFRRRYYRALDVNQEVLGLASVLLVDDVITTGVTVSCAARRLAEANPNIDLVVASAGQMIVKAVVRDERGFV